MTTLQKVKLANKGWFSRKNKQFFGDISYRVLHGKESKKPYLVRSTFQWSDMFGNEKEVYWRVNNINECLGMGSLTDKVFTSLESVKIWLQDN